MKRLGCVCQWIVGVGVVLAGVVALQAQAAQTTFEPTVGQAGKDVVWVPTPAETVEKMLDMAQVTARDFVMDLGSGDGRNIIAAAKRGARGVGVEFNPNMVELSRRTAATEGVADRATFVEGDMFTADISKATVMALFLLPDNLRRLTPTFLNLRPGTRIVANTFGIEGWTPDAEDSAGGDCGSWCKTLLYIVPAKVPGAWRMAQGELTLSQDFQMVSGTLSSGGQSTPIEKGRLRGEQITFVAAGVEYTGRVDGDTIEGTTAAGGTKGSWRATRAR